MSPARKAGYRRTLLEPHQFWLMDQVQCHPHITLAMLQEILELCWNLGDAA